LASAIRGRNLTPISIIISAFSSSAPEQITVRGDNIPDPVHSFDEAGFPDKITEKLKSKYEKPSTIQGITWPIALNGRDLISVAKTGSGKTLGVSTLLNYFTYQLF
jgi:superfamily II DNA/RNA helicase